MFNDYGLYVDCVFVNMVFRTLIHPKGEFRDQSNR